MSERRRKSLRIPGYDYATPGSYFVTLCASDRRPRFSNVSEGDLALTAAGEMLETVWHELPLRFPDVSINSIIVMPDHVHGIILITGHDDMAAQTPVGKIIQAFKSLSTHHYMHGVRTNGWPAFQRKLWQQNYYEHVIRSDASLDRHRAYIADNPSRRWMKRGS